MIQIYSLDAVSTHLRNPHLLIKNRLGPFKICLRHSRLGYLRSRDAYWAWDAETAYNYPNQFNMIDFYVRRDIGTPAELRSGESIGVYLLTSISAPVRCAEDDILLGPKDIK